MGQGSTRMSLLGMVDWQSARRRQLRHQSCRGWQDPTPPEPEGHSLVSESPAQVPQQRLIDKPSLT